MTESSVYLTTAAQAERAVAIAAAKKAALKHIDAVAAEKRGEFKQVRNLDGLGLLYKAGELTDDMHRVGLKYQSAFDVCFGRLSRDSTDQGPPGDRDAALQARVDSGRLIERCEAHCTTEGEKAALRSIVGLGHSVRSVASGRKYREMCELVIDLLGRMVRGGL